MSHPFHKTAPIDEQSHWMLLYIYGVHIEYLSKTINLTFVFYTKYGIMPNSDCECFN